MRKNKNKPETVDTSSVSETEELNVPRKKKKKTGLVVFLIILVLAVAGAAACYFMERQKPISTTRNYLENVQAMNFDGMKNLLQSNDMSALDNADITSEAYTNFFKAINQKMTFEIRKTKFNIQNGTATVTAHIKYIDGSDIYKEAVTEFFQQIASSAFSGETTTAEETQKRISVILLSRLTANGRSSLWMMRQLRSCPLILSMCRMRSRSRFLSPELLIHQPHRLPTVLLI